jgi:hypothetical protein
VIGVSPGGNAAVQAAGVQAIEMSPGAVQTDWTFPPRHLHSQLACAGSGVRAANRTTTIPFRIGSSISHVEATNSTMRRIGKSTGGFYFFPTWRAYRGRCGATMQRSGVRWTSINNRQLSCRRKTVFPNHCKCNALSLCSQSAASEIVVRE